MTQQSARRALIRSPFCDRAVPAYGEAFAQEYDGEAGRSQLNLSPQVGVAWTRLAGHHISLCVDLRRPVERGRLLAGAYEDPRTFNKVA